MSGGRGGVAPGRAEAIRCLAVVALVALAPVLGAVSGGAFGFPGSTVWMLVVAPVALVWLAGGGDGPDGSDGADDFGGTDA